VRVHGDQIVPERQPGPALDGRSAADVLDAAQASAAAQGLTSADRVLSTGRWDTADDLIERVLALYVVGASLVLVANPDAKLEERRWQTEKLTKTSL
jgi:hypothetical protein